MRWLLPIALIACGEAETAVAPPTPEVARADARIVVPPAELAKVNAGVVAPPFRLPDGVTPTRYDLTLELDPASETFTGHVAIEIAVAAPVTRIWLHAAELELTRATLDGLPVTIEPSSTQVRGFVLPHPVGHATVTLAIEYTGHVATLTTPSGKDEEGMFRERLHGQWFLYSQAESIFTRRIVPCFDEPRWKPQWRVTVVAPRDQVALGNGPAIAERLLPDQRKETRFAEVGPMPSYVLAVAVGPFELVDLGKLGRAHVPVRLAVARGDAPRALQATRALPAIIAALETYLDAPLPLAKLDLVSVPQFFGAMENPGLVTFERETLVFGRDFIDVAAHELAHQWFGDAVTPIWWEHLWLSEGFASWLGERVSRSLEGKRGPLVLHRERVRALRADDDVETRPLVHPIAASNEVEPAFDAIAYEKGGALLATFEQFAGVDAFRDAVRAYIRDHAGTAVGSRAFLDAVAAHTSPEIAAALESELGHAGTPVVDLELRCEPAPVVIAATRDGVTVPVCLRYPGIKRGATDCFLAGAGVEHPLASCPAWLVGNDGGRGYYQVAWKSAWPDVPAGVLSADELLARGDDVAFALRRGDITLDAALHELARLASSGELYGELAAISIARTIDRIVDDANRPAWSRWLASQFPARIRATRAIAMIDYVMRAQLVDLAPDAFGKDAVAGARALADRDPSRPVDPTVIRLAAVHDPAPLFDSILAAAEATTRDDVRDDLLEELGSFPAPFAQKLADLVVQGPLPAARAWSPLESMFARGETRTAAWRATHAQLPAILDKLSASDGRRVIEATESLCDPAQRAEVAADFTPRAATMPGGQAALERSLATIDRCLARRARVGDLAAAFAAAERR